MATADTPRKLWTRAEYRRLTEAGFLTDGQVELVNGEIWRKVDKDRRHSAALARLLAVIAGICDYECLQIRASTPLSDDSDPEPDLAMLAKSLIHYIDCDPGPSDVVFAAEISVLTLHADLIVKQLLYAQSGIPEYWVVDIPNRLLHVFREPTADGYASETTLTTADEVQPLAAPDAIVRVAELLP